MVVIWKLIEDDKNKEKTEWEDAEDTTVIDLNDICMTILEFLTRTGYNCTQDEFLESVKFLDQLTVVKLFTRGRDQVRGREAQIEFEDRLGLGHVSRR